MHSITENQFSLRKYSLLTSGSRPANLDLFGCNLSNHGWSAGSEPWTHVFHPSLTCSLTSDLGHAIICYTRTVVFTLEIRTGSPLQLMVSCSGLEGKCKPQFSNSRNNGLSYLNKEKNQLGGHNDQRKERGCKPEDGETTVCSYR